MSRDDLYSQMSYISNMSLRKDASKYPKCPVHIYLDISYFLFRSTYVQRTRDMVEMSETLSKTKHDLLLITK